MTADDEYDEEMRRYWVAMDARNEAWKSQWPNHCHACGGWGGSHHLASGLSYRCGGEPRRFDPCDARKAGTCHRCGEADAIDEEKGTPCKFCGWNFDDGLAEQ